MTNKRTGFGWNKIYRIKFIDLSGFDNEDYYNRVNISLDDFLNRAALCKIQKPENVSRREAAKLKKNII